MEFIFWPKMLFCTFFKKKQEGSPYMYASEVWNKSVCEHELCDAHDRRITTNKIWRNICHVYQNRTVRFGKLNHSVLSAKPQKPEYPVSKTRTSGFSRLSVLTRKHTPMISRHSHIHICINRT
jgi:hypothetical protein